MRSRSAVRSRRTPESPPRAERDSSRDASVRGEAPPERNASVRRDGAGRRNASTRRDDRPERRVATRGAVPSKREPKTAESDSIAADRRAARRWLRACSAVVVSCSIAALGIRVGSLVKRVDPQAAGPWPTGSSVVADPATVTAAAATLHDWSAVVVALGTALGCVAVGAAAVHLSARVVGRRLFRG